MPNYDDLNNILNTQYTNRVEHLKQYLNKDSKLIFALDKWTNKQQEKFIGVYVYQEGVRVFLGLINYTFKCGANEMKGYLLELLHKFAINRKRVLCKMSDCGVDMVKLCKVLKVSHIPRLAKLLIYWVKNLWRLLLSILTMSHPITILS